jgi:predicted RNA-binding Zn-ribbon protein involved in translation (DUF1610 family)
MVYKLLKENTTKGKNKTNPTERFWLFIEEVREYLESSNLYPCPNCEEEMSAKLGRFLGSISKEGGRIFRFSYVPYCPYCGYRSPREGICEIKTPRDSLRIERLNLY